MYLLYLTFQLLTTLSVVRASDAPAVSNAKQHCTMVQKLHPNPSLRCGWHGPLDSDKEKKLHALTPVEDVAVCASLCQLTQNCVSFGFGLTTNQCQMYSKSLMNMDISPQDANSTDLTTVFYNRKCWKQNCVKVPREPAPCVCTAKVTETILAYNMTSTILSTIFSTTTRLPEWLTIGVNSTRVNPVTANTTTTLNITTQKVLDPSTVSVFANVTTTQVFNVNATSYANSTFVSTVAPNTTAAAWTTTETDTVSLVVTANSSTSELAKRTLMSFATLHAKTVLKQCKCAATAAVASTTSITSTKTLRRVATVTDFITILETVTPSPVIVSSTEVDDIVTTVSTDVSIITLNQTITSTPTPVYLNITSTIIQNTTVTSTYATTSTVEVIETAKPCPVGFTVKVYYPPSEKTEYVLSYDSTGTGGEVFKISSIYGNDNAASFGIDPESGLFCSNAADELTAVYADQISASKTLFFNSAAFRTMNPSYLEGSVTAMINDDLILSLNNSLTGNSIILDCGGYLSLGTSNSKDCTTIELGVVPIADAPTTTTVTTTTTTSTFTPLPPAPTCTSLSLQAVGGGAGIDGQYVQLTGSSGSQTIVFSSNPSASTIFTIDPDQHLIVNGYYADINAGASYATVYFDPAKSIAANSWVYLVCSLQPGALLQCEANDASVFQMSGSTVMIGQTLQDGNTPVSFKATCSS